jgi:hypothetical protein
MKRNVIIAVIFLTLLYYSKGIFNSTDKKKSMIKELFTKKYGATVANTVLAIFNALAKSGLPLQTIKYCISQIMLETGNLDPKVSKVSLLNGNYSGITWSGSDAQRATGATKGSPRPKDEGSNYAKYPNVASWAKDYIRILNRKSKPIAATNISEFASRLAANGYYDTDPVKRPNAIKNYTNSLTTYYNFLTKAGI